MGEILEFSLFTSCFNPIAEKAWWNHQEDVTDILVIEQFHKVKPSFNISDLNENNESLTILKT